MSFHYFSNIKIGIYNLIKYKTILIQFYIDISTRYYTWHGSWSTFVSWNESTAIAPPWTDVPNRQGHKLKSIYVETSLFILPQSK